LYALLFADTGLSEAEISALFALWGTVAVVSEVPSGALADRFSRRWSLVAASVLQALGYGIWILLPGFAGFAAGFVLWGIGGSLMSGAFQALVYDGLKATGSVGRYATVIGRCEAAGLAVQVPVAAAASLLFALGGYELAGWVSIGACLAAAGFAVSLPDHRVGGGEDEPRERAGYLATLRAGLREVASSPRVSGAVVVVALLYGSEALEEYFGLVATTWGVPTGIVPLALLAIPLAGAAGALFGGPAARLGPAGLTVLLGTAAGALGAAALAQRPAGLAGVAVFYGLWRIALVVADARLQDSITGRSRATVSSVAGLGSEVAGLAMFGAWAAGGLNLAVALALAAALVLPRKLGSP